MSVEYSVELLYIECFIFIGECYMEYVYMEYVYIDIDIDVYIDVDKGLWVIL